MVFEKFESWAFRSPQPASLYPQAWNFWAQRGYALHSTGPYALQGRSFQSKIGIHRVVDLTALDSGGGTVLQLRYRADVSPEAAAGGVVAAVLLLPLAVVGAAISWHEYETDWSRERWEFWNFLVSGAKAEPVAGAPLPPAPEAPVPSVPTVPALRTCPACQAPVTGEGRFCASCGAAIPLPPTGAAP